MKRTLWLRMAILLLLPGMASCTQATQPDLEAPPDDSGPPNSQVAPDSVPPDQSGAEGIDPAPAVDAVPLTYTGIQPRGLTSYRSQFVLAFQGTDGGGAPLDLRYSVSQVVSTDPPVQSFTVEADGTGITDATRNIQILQIEDVSYLISDGACLSSAGANQSVDGIAYNPDTFLIGSDFSGASRITPDELVNGVESRHYRFTENDVVLSTAGFTTFRGDIWTAVDGGNVVRQAISADGSAEAFGGAQGHLEWTYDLLDINLPVSITPPAGCAPPASQTLPLISDAANVSSMGGLVSYTTVFRSEAVADFYNQEMPEQGWTASEISADTPGLATLEFVRGDETAVIVITEEALGTSVVITIE